MMPVRRLATVTLVVRDYDEAVRFYVDRLDFYLIADTPLGNGKRWVLIAPTENSPVRLLLAQAATPPQNAAIGNQTGGRVAFFLETDNFQRDYCRFSERGVRFIEPPRSEPYGIVAVFTDLYGNTWDLIQPV